MCMRISSSRNSLCEFPNGNKTSGFVQKGPRPFLKRSGRGLFFEHRFSENSDSGAAKSTSLAIAFSAFIVLNFMNARDQFSTHLQLFQDDEPQNFSPSRRPCRGRDGAFKPSRAGQKIDDSAAHLPPRAVGNGGAVSTFALRNGHLLAVGYARIAGRGRPRANASPSICAKKASIFLRSLTGRIRKY